MPISARGRAPRPDWLEDESARPVAAEARAASRQLADEIAALVARGVAAARRPTVRRVAEGDPAAPAHAETRYWYGLARSLGLPFTTDLSGATPVHGTGPLTIDAVRRATTVLIREGGRETLVAAPQGAELVLLRRRLAAMPTLGLRVKVAPPEVIRAFIAAHRHAALTHYAVHRLARVLPSLSAARGRSPGASGHKILVAAFLALGLVAPLLVLQAFAVASSLFFLNCSAWKIAAAFRRARPLRVEPLADNRLPSYTVLVPLYREAAVVADLVAHLARLDYPSAKLEVLMLVEAGDAGTREAVGRHARLPPFRTIVIPPGGPRTKPKALTYALAFARGDYVVVFDAEDRPEPDQLRRAASAFAERPELGCLQARLAPDNGESWLARMFTLEYAANFEIVLPALSAWRVPLPLGGTSNHFPRAVLEKVGGWDPYNVTEDADLGIRLARFGFGSATIVSRTYEEAPVTFRQWLPQRRRWIKGWIQTVAVALGRGISPGLQLPFRQRLAVHGVLTAGVLGLLLYPASLVLIGAAAVEALRGALPSGPVSWVLLSTNAFNFAAVLGSAVVTSLRGVWSARVPRLAWHIPLLPFYWALMSLAAWQALFQYYRRPSAWEKTTHGIARERRNPPAQLF